MKINKMKKVGMRVLSTVLALLLVFTSFSVYDIWSVVSNATVDTDTEESSGTPAISFYVPETIYLKPTTSAKFDEFQFFVDREAMGGDLRTGEHTEGNIYFKCKTATKVTSLTLSGTSSVTIGATSSSNGTLQTTITAGRLSTALDQNSCVTLTWTIKYMASINGGAVQECTAKAYTVCYSPYVSIVGTAVRQKVNSSSSSKVFIQQIAWWQGVHGFEDKRDALIDKDSLKNALDPSSSDQGDVWLHNATGTYAAKTKAEDSAHYLDPMLNDIKISSNGKEAATDWLKDDGVRAKSIFYSSAERLPGTRWSTNFTTGYTAKLTTDKSRYTNYNQIPNLKVGVLQTDNEFVNGMQSYYISVYGTSSSDKYYNVVINSDSTEQKNADNYDSDYRYSDKSTNEDKRIAAGTYPNSGSMTNGLHYNGTVNYSITDSMDFAMKSFIHGKRDKVSYAANVAYCPISVICVDKRSLREMYEAAIAKGYQSNSSSDSGWAGKLSTLNSAISAAGAILGNPLKSGQAEIDTAKTNLNDAVTACENAIGAGGSSGSTTTVDEVFFVVPETIYLYPTQDTNSTNYCHFQYVLDSKNEIKNGVASSTVYQGYHTMSNRETTGITFYYKNASQVTIQASGSSLSTLTFYTTTGNGNDTGKSITASSGNTIQSCVNGGSMSSYASGWIKWTATYFDTSDNLLKKAYAWTYVYAPFTGVVAGIASARTSSSSSRDVTDVAWISGIHSITNDKPSGTDSDHTGSYKYPYMTTPTYPLSSNNQDNQPINVNSGSGANFFYKSDASATCWGGEGLLNVDTTRFNNYKNIPNLVVGVDVTRFLSAHTADGYTFTYAFDSSIQKKNADQSGINNATVWKNESGNAGIGRWYTTIDKTVNTSWTYLSELARVHAKKDSGRTAYSGSFLKFNYISKSKLRSEVMRAINKNAKFQSYFFAADSTYWSTYETRLEEAYKMLCQVDSSTDPSSTVTNLNTAVDQLEKIADTKPITVKQANVMLLGQSNGNYKVLSIDEETKSGVAAYDSVKFTENSYSGYHFVGLKKTGSNFGGATEGSTVSSSALTCPSTDDISKTDINPGNEWGKNNGGILSVEASKHIVSYTHANNDIYMVYYYILDPEVLFDNELDFDNYFNGAYDAENVVIDRVKNTIEFKSTTDDSFTTPYTDTSRYMAVIPGHTYRLSYDYESSGAGNLDSMFFGYESNSTTDYRHTQRVKINIDSSKKGTYTTTYTVASDDNYIAIRLGIRTQGITVKFSNIVVQDITQPIENGVADNVSAASPVKVDVVAQKCQPGAKINQVASTTRTGMKFLGWYTGRDTYGNGNGTEVTKNTSTNNYNIHVWSKWEIVPEVIFDNLLDFDKWVVASSISKSGSVAIDKAGNKLSVTCPASATNAYFYPTSYRMEVKAKHTYRVMFTATNTGSNPCKTGYYLNKYAVASGGATIWSGQSYGEIYSDTQLSAGASKDYNFTFEATADYPYVTLRLNTIGVNSKEGTITYSDIYIYDITNDAGRADNKTPADPKSMTVEKGTAIGKLANQTRKGYNLAGWADAAGNPYSETSMMPTNGDNVQLFSQWTADTFILKYKGNPTANTETVSDMPVNGKNDPSADSWTLIYDMDSSASSDKVISTAVPKNTSKNDEKENVFVGWNTKADGSGDTYYPGDTISESKINEMYDNKQKVEDDYICYLYAIWFDTKPAKVDAAKKDNTLKQFSTNIVRGVSVDGNGKYVSTLYEMVGETSTKVTLTKFDEGKYSTYTNAIDNYDDAKDAYGIGKSSQTVTSTTVSDLEEWCGKVSDAAKDLENTESQNEVVDTYNNKFIVKDSNKETTYTLADMNLNHYKIAKLNEAKTAKSDANTDAYSSGTTLRKAFDSVTDSKGSGSAQAKLNTAVETMAKAFVTKATAKELEVAPNYQMYESHSAVQQLLDNEDLTGVNFVMEEAGSFTYHCYTNSTNPTIVLNVDEATVSETAGGKTYNRACYPTTAELVSSSSDSASIKSVTAANTAYEDFTDVGIGTKILESKANYYNKKDRITLHPNFGDGSIPNDVGDSVRKTATYTFESYDDSYVPNGKNYAQKGKTASNKFTNNAEVSFTGTKVNIIIYYKPANGLSVTAEQWGGDKWLHQFHLFRTSGGANNWEIFGWDAASIKDATKDGGNAKPINIYPVYDEVYGQAAKRGETYGSFIYTFKVEGSENNAANCSMKDATVENAKNFFKVKSNYDTVRKKGWSGTDTGGTGLGFVEWPGTASWSCNYYPRSRAYTYVHLIDRWGNVFDEVFECPNLDPKAVKANTASAGSAVIEESGGSGINTMTLSGSFEIITDENSELNGNVYKTTGNTVKLYTGEANRGYSLSMTDHAENASTASVKSDADGYIVFDISDTEHSGGVYTFSLNGYEINLFDGVAKDGAVVDVDYTPALGTRNVYKVKVTDRANMVQFIELGSGNGTGTRSYDRHHDSVEITSYDKDGNEVKDTDKNLAYEIWTIKLSLADGLTGVRAKTRGSSKWEDKSLAYTFNNQYHMADSDVKSAALSKESGSAGAVPFTVVTGADAQAIQMKTEDGRTVTIVSEKATDNQNGTLTFNGRVWFYGTGTQTATVRVLDAYGWKDVTTVSYTIE